MSKTKRTFSKEEKLNILKEASKNGVKVTLDKYSIYAATYYSWKNKFEQMGEKGFEHGMTPRLKKEVRRLEKEVSLLKKLVAEKEMVISLKDEQLKKR